MIAEGGWTARNTSCPLTVYWYQLPYYRVNHELGELQNPAGWSSQYQSYRVTYVGGFDPIPEDLQMAVAELVRVTHAADKLDPNLSAETIDKYSYTRNTAMKGIDLLPWAAKLALNRYKLVPVARYT